MYAAKVHAQSRRFSVTAVFPAFGVYMIIFHDYIKLFLSKMILTITYTVYIQVFNQTVAGCIGGAVQSVTVTVVIEQPEIADILKNETVFCRMRFNVTDKSVIPAAG